MEYKSLRFFTNVAVPLELREGGVREKIEA